MCNTYSFNGSCILNSFQKAISPHDLSFGYWLRTLNLPLILPFYGKQCWRHQQIGWKLFFDFFLKILWFPGYYVNFSFVVSFLKISPNRNSRMVDGWYSTRFLLELFISPNELSFLSMDWCVLISIYPTYSKSLSKPCYE